MQGMWNLWNAAGEKIAIKANISGSGVFADDTSGETQMSHTSASVLWLWRGRERERAQVKQKESSLKKQLFYQDNLTEIILSEKSVKGKNILSRLKRGQFFHRQKRDKKI